MKLSDMQVYRATNSRAKVKAVAHNTKLAETLILFSLDGRDFSAVNQFGLSGGSRDYKATVGCPDFGIATVRVVFDGTTVKIGDDVYELDSAVSTVTIDPGTLLQVVKLVQIDGGHLVETRHRLTRKGSSFVNGRLVERTGGLGQVRGSGIVADSLYSGGHHYRVTGDPNDATTHVVTFDGKPAKILVEDDYRVAFSGDLKRVVSVQKR